MPKVWIEKQGCNVNTKHKISLEFPPMKASKLRTLLGIVNKSSLEVEFYVEQIDSYRTKTFYHNDIVTNPLFKKTNEEIVYDSYSVNLIEY